jgi:hypothetical protein
VSRDRTPIAAGLISVSEAVELPASHWDAADPGAEQVQLELIRAATTESRADRLRITTDDRVIEFDVDLSMLQPHQDASVRLQCAIAASRTGRAGLLVHSAGLGLPNRGAVVALAVSGGGKSTLSNLSTQFFGLSDETVLLTPGPPPTISATPLRSISEKIPEPRTEPLKALLFLEKSLQPSYTRIPPHEALPRLLAQAYKFPTELATTAHLFKRASQLVENVPAFRFAFPKSPDAQTLLLRLYDEVLDPHLP